MFSSAGGWALITGAVAVLWALLGDGTAFGPMVFALVAGFFLGYVVLGAFRRGLSARADLLLHILLAALLGLVGMFIVPRLAEIMPWLRSWAPQPVLALVPVVGMVVVSFTAVVWLLLLSRAVAAIPNRDPRDRPAPEWEVRTSSGTEAWVTAVPMTRRAYGWVVALVGVLIGLALWAVFALGSPKIWWWPPKLVLLALGIGIALPIVLAARAALRARTRQCRVEFAGSRVTLWVAARPGAWRGEEFASASASASASSSANADASANTVERTSFAFRELDEFVWCATGDGARLELRSGERHTSLLVGIARPRPGLSAALPPLSRRVRAELAEAGLAEVSPRTPGRARVQPTPARPHPVLRFIRDAAPAASAHV
ncbi:hypothetical protein [Leucobacter chromiireducens]|uniref:Uncharacterized protein n=1 Tax=Leucobacter chromiireducens subsp. chromiireducens TaxID=660067 RepID=A0ABS1SSD7_9MICO|nr:hypothetical protein [Leucobacter chromiireducens]MBL3691050.1 hypothetical protein [Leucobacter chromiireducens subsp. chromiireducens]